MRAVTEKRPETNPASEEVAPPTDSVVGWQGIRCVLPPEWNVTGFSMDRDSGYLRIDAPGNSTMTAQIRWSNAAKTAQGAPTLFTLLGSLWRQWRKQPAPPVPRPNLKANLEKLLKDTAKQARKGKAAFESSIKPERVEGDQDERTAINYTWSGEGRGQGKIWYCETCHRIVVAQLVGMAKDQAAITAIASQLFGTLRDHAEDGFDLWALYDLQMSVPEDFRLESQKLLSGHLQLVFQRGAERIVLQRWGLANMTLKKFTPAEWFRLHALVNLKRLPAEERETPRGHPMICHQGPLPWPGRLRALREAKGSPRRFPTRYAGGVWLCAETNKLFVLQVFYSAKKSEGLWEEVLARCVCH